MYLKKHCFHLFFDKGWFLFPTIRWTPTNPSKIHFGQHVFPSWASRPESGKSIRCSGCFNRDGRNGRSNVLWEAERENGGNLELKKRGVSENSGFSPPTHPLKKGLNHYKSPIHFGGKLFWVNTPNLREKRIGSTSTSLGGLQEAHPGGWRGSIWKGGPQLEGGPSNSTYKWRSKPYKWANTCRV